MGAHGAWRGWYHIIGTTYGTWLQGDRRGWRARHHRQYVDGDCRRPPEPWQFDCELTWSRGMMRRDAVLLTGPQRRLAGESLVWRLARERELLVLACAQTHFHLLARLGGCDIRQAVGLAKKHASHVLSHDGLTGGLWGKRSRSVPVTSRQQQVRVFEYIRAHADQGAWVWTFRDPPIARPEWDACLPGPPQR